jgi:peptidoglycan hydrolase-like protein with peptidoglycan-binding domain
MSSQLTTDDMTQSVQLHLQYLGIDPGNTSGELSVDTQIAISEFEASKGMKVTGEVTPQLLGILSAEVDSGQ